MLNKIVVALLLAILTTAGVYGQKKERKKDEQIRQLKIEFVTQQMKLSSQQLQQFLPLYNKYSDELLVHRFALKDLEANPNSRYQVEERQRIEQKMVEIKGKYKNDFLKIVSADQLANMYKAEGDFKKVLINYLKKRQ